MLRGFSGAEKLAFTPAVRQWVVDAEDFSLELMVGCPAELFQTIGNVLEAGKAYLAKQATIDAFRHTLDSSTDALQQWQLDKHTYPTADAEWKFLADAYRQTCILRVLRFPNGFETPCTDTRIRESVDKILEACAQVPWSSPFYKRMLFPLFMAGADTVSHQQQHYVKLCIAEIHRITGFPQPAVMAILETVWNERVLESQIPGAAGNVPWMEYVSLS